MHNLFPIIEIQKDIELAAKLKTFGEAGQSRVSARKAAGKAVRYWLISEQLFEINSVSTHQ